MLVRVTSAVPGASASPPGRNWAEPSSFPAVTARTASSLEEIVQAMTSSTLKVMTRPTATSAVVWPGSTMTGPIMPASPPVDSDGAAAELDVVLSDEPPQAVSTPAPPRAMMLAAAMLRPRRAFERM
jgi:hypothetical protein